MPLADNLQAPRRENGPALLEVAADRGEDELVLAVGAKLLRIRARHHALDDERRRPRLNVGEAVFGQLRVALRVDQRFGHLVACLRRKRRVEERVHRLRAVRAAQGRVVDLGAATRVRILLEPLGVELALLSAVRTGRFGGRWIRGRGIRWRGSGRTRRGRGGWGHFFRHIIFRTVATKRRTLLSSAATRQPILRW